MNGPQFENPVFTRDSSGEFVCADMSIKLILSVTVGSRAHGTDSATSDIDTRSVYLYPTSTLVSLTPRPRFKAGRGLDDNCWELDRFIDLSMKGNPATLEVLMVQPDTVTPEGEELRALYPHFLRKIAVWGSFKGFAKHQRVTMRSQTSKRRVSSGAHYLRVLYNGAEILRTGTMSVRIMDTPLGATVMAAKRGELSFDEVERLGAELEADLDRAYSVSTLPEEANLAAINDFLIRTRKANW
jgi:Predicted nucleotidyltransferase